MTVMKWMSCIVPILEFVGRAQGQAIVQIQVQPQVVGRSIQDGQVTTVFLAPRYVTAIRSEEHTSELQSLRHLVCRLLLEKKKHRVTTQYHSPFTSCKTNHHTLVIKH